jgi:hypothetical protein
MSKAYISEYGNWGLEEVLILDEDDLSSAQWEMVDSLPDYDKMVYAKAVLAGEDLSKWDG